MSSYRELVRRAIDSAETLPASQQETFVQLVLRQEKYFDEIAEKTTTDGIDTIAKIFLPTLKKIQKHSVLDKILGVQPITRRICSVKYLDVVYASAKADEGIVAGSSALENVSENYSLAPKEGEDITRELIVKLREIPVKAIKRALLMNWTWEAEDAFEDEEGSALSSQLSKALSGKIASETNFAYISELFARAEGGTVAWESPLEADAPSVQERKEVALYHKVTELAGKIHNSQSLYPNVILCNPITGSFLKRSGKWEAHTTDPESMVIGRKYVTGTLENDFYVVIVPGLKTNDILVGYKGDSELDCGAIHAPYKPLVITDAQFNPKSWDWLQSIGSFYASAFPNMKLYGKVTVTIN